MQISVSDAKARLLDLVRRAEAGEEIILTRHGAEVVRLVRAVRRSTIAERRRLSPLGLGGGAKWHNCRLLFVGNDFSQTDLPPA